MKKGLNLTARTREDAREISERLNASDLHFEYNSVEGFYFFPEDEEMYGELEAEIEKVLMGLNYRTEGVF